MITRSDRYRVPPPSKWDIVLLAILPAVGLCVFVLFLLFGGRGDVLVICVGGIDGCQVCQNGGGEGEGGDQHRVLLTSTVRVGVVEVEVAASPTQGANAGVPHFCRRLQTLDHSRRRGGTFATWLEGL